MEYEKSNEMPREKLERLDAESLKYEELLAILIGHGWGGKNVFQLVAEISANYSLDELLSMPLKELRKVPGIGHARACLIVASLELAKRYFKEQLGILPIISEPEHVLPLVSDLRKEKKEHLVGVYLNARNQMIHHETISIGTLNANIIHPREVFEPAVRVKAAGIILVHNHPSGDETPSEEDVAITQRLYESGRLLGIDLLDHLIITENALFSMTRQGILKGGRLDG